MDEPFSHLDAITARTLRRELHDMWKATGKTIVSINEKYFRPAEVEILLGDPTRAKNELGWTPKVTFAEHLRIFTSVLPLSEADRRAVLGETANRLYFRGKLKDEQA